MLLIAAGQILLYALFAVVRVVSNSVGNGLAQWVVLALFAAVLVYLVPKAIQLAIRKLSARRPPNIFEIFFSFYFAPLIFMGLFGFLYVIVDSIIESIFSTTVTTPRFGIIGVQAFAAVVSSIYIKYFANYPKPDEPDSADLEKSE